MSATGRFIFSAAYVVTEDDDDVDAIDFDDYETLAYAANDVWNLLDLYTDPSIDLDNPTHHHLLKVAYACRLAGCRLTYVDADY